MKQFKQIIRDKKGLLLAAIALLVIAVFVAIPHRRSNRKRLCHEVRKNISIVCGAMQDEEDTAARGNKAGRGPFTAEQVIQNLIYRFTGEGKCVDFLPGHCKGISTKRMRDPFNGDLPAFVLGKDNYAANSGQIALYVELGSSVSMPDTPMYSRDLSWEPVCGETQPLRRSVVIPECPRVN